MCNGSLFCRYTIDEIHNFFVTETETDRGAGGVCLVAKRFKQVVGFSIAFFLFYLFVVLHFIGFSS